MNTTTAILATVGLLLGNAFFVGAEFALMSARRSRVEPLVERGVRGAKTVLGAIENLSLMLATAQLGVTVCSTGLGVVAEPALAHLFEAPLVWAGVPASYSHIFGFSLALALVVYVHVVAGEMVPKNLAVTKPETAALILGPPLVWISRLILPVIWILNRLANVFLHLMRVEPKDEVASAMTAEEVASVIERSEAEGLLEDRIGILAGAIEFSEETAGDIMVRPEQLHTLAWDVTPQQVENAVAKTGYSRFPLRRENGSLSGYIHVKDVLHFDEQWREKPIPGSRVRPLITLDESKEVEEALRLMQRSRSHLAEITREGKPVGVLFLEDILEELVGEVSDSMQRESGKI